MAQNDGISKQYRKKKKNHIFFSPRPQLWNDLLSGGKILIVCVSWFLINHIRSQGHVNQLNHVSDIIIECIIKKEKKQRGML